LQENYDVYDAELKQILQEMRMFLREGKIPPIEKGQKCSGCSMKDLCMPTRRKYSSLQKTIAQLLEEKP
ncbi:MAG: Dna2/Cas4 domain-containing protein, partial [Clostridia bacterium]|nr:Dna2/Cas4 domain-containing protein [Clostridia bacterium]